MGGKSSKMGAPGEANKSQAVQDALRERQAADSVLIKLLLLGAGESGKSTLFRQMVRLFGQGFTDKDLKMYIPMIHNNILTAAKELSKQSIKMGAEDEQYASSDEAVAKSVQLLAEEVKVEEQLTVELAEHIKAMWADEAIQKTYAQRSRFQLVDSANYFFDDIERFGAEEFMPNDDDLIRCRVRTTGIVEQKFTIDESQFLMVDVGGQRNERKKWIHCFDGVTAVIFVASLAGYNQTLYEDNVTNRMDEALQLFEDTVGLEWFSRTSFILFLNQCDLFKEKIAIEPLTEWIPTYDGSSYEDGVAFIRNHFEQRFVKKSTEKLYVHVTCATDQRNVAAVFSAVKDIIIQRHLKESGLM